MSKGLPQPIGNEYEFDTYLSRLQKRFPFLEDKTKEELLSILNENKKRDPADYDYHNFPIYEKNLKKKYSTALKEKIIKNRAEKYFNKGYYDTIEAAYERSRTEMMPTRKFTKFATIASHIFEQMNLQPNRDNLKISTNRYGEQSRYLFFGSGENKYAIKISDHFAINSLFTKDDIPILYTIIVNDKLNEYNAISFLDFKYLHDEFEWSEIYNMVEEEIDENSTKGLKKFLRQMKFDEDSNQKKLKDAKDALTGKDYYTEKNR